MRSFTGGQASAYASKMAERDAFPDLPPRMSPEEHWSENEAVRVERLRADAKRPLGVNLAAGLALSEFLTSFAGSLDHLLAMKRAADRPGDRIDIEALEAAHSGPGPDE